MDDREKTKVNMFKGSVKCILYNVVDLCLQTKQSKEELLDEVSSICDHLEPQGAKENDIIRFSPRK